MKQRVHIVVGNASWVSVAKQALAEDGSVIIQFINQYNWYKRRKEIFGSFGGIDINIERVSRTEVHVLLIDERIRTNAVKTTESAQKSAEQLKYPKELPLKSRGSLHDFEEAVEDTIVEIDGVKVYPCACCGRYLSSDCFGKRTYGTVAYRQAYCASCMRYYSIWRNKFLQAHNADRLTPNFTAGNKQRNELFRTWYAENVGDE